MQRKVRIIVAGTIALNVMGFVSTACGRDLVGSWKLTAFYDRSTPISGQ